MKRSFACRLLILSLFCSAVSFAQNVTIMPGGITPVLSCTYPRLSYDGILALPSPQIGDIAYDLTFLCLRVYNGSKWLCTYQNPNNPGSNVSFFASAGGVNNDNGHDVVVDASGNVYVVGSFSGTINFGGISKSSVGFGDIFIAKYNSSGTIQWVQTAGGSGNDSGVKISTDGSGNIYIAGIFYDTADFGGISKSSAGQYDVFVAKYNSSGSVQWVQAGGGTQNDFLGGVAVDGSGNVSITGQFSGTADFGGNSRTSAGSQDIFIAKYDSNGNIQWVQTAGGGSLDNGGGLAVDGSQNVYITGEFSGTTNFGGTSKTAVGNTDIFVAKYNSGGTFQWVQTAGGTNDNAGLGIAVDASGTVYATGRFTGTTNFGGTNKTSAGGTDVYLVKYNSSGIFQWVQTAGGTDADYERGVAIDGSGNVYSIGYFAGTTNFGGISKASAGGWDIFVAKYTSSGTIQWLQTAGGTDYDTADGITAVNGSVYVTGGFSGTASFGDISKTSVGGYDVFVVRVQ